VKILSIDPAGGNTGYAFAVDGHVIDAGFKEFTKTEVDGDRYLEAHRWLKDMLYSLKPATVVMESFFFSSRFRNGSSVNAEVRGVFKMTCVEAGVPYVITDPSGWKKTLLGRVNPTKVEKKLYGKTKAKKMITYNKLVELGASFPEKLINTKTGNMVNFRFDVSDAIGMLAAHLIGIGVPLSFSQDIFLQE
jgi:Holliday junction resolvasome RuvABC endonuclease subunit